MPKKSTIAIFVALFLVWVFSFVGVVLFIKWRAPDQSAQQQAAQAPAAQPKKPQLSFPVKSDTHRFVSEGQMYELAQIAASMGRLEGAIKEERLVWAKKVEKAVEKLTEEYKGKLGKRSDLIEQIAKERKLKVSCFIAFLDEKAQNACGPELWGIGTEGEILVAR